MARPAVNALAQRATGLANPPGTGMGVPAPSNAEQGYGYEPMAFLTNPQSSIGANNPTIPTLQMAQQLAAMFRDPATLASTIGIKSQKADKIKKVKK